jgi:hypothetical protein
VDQQENLSVDIWRFFEDLEEIRRGGGPATDRFPSSRPKGESDFDPHRAISPTREPRGGAVSLSVRDERGGSYLPGTAPETTPLFDRTNLHPLYPRLLDLLNRNSRTSFIPAKKFPFRTRERFPQRVVGGNAWVCADYSIWCDQEFFKT